MRALPVLIVLFVSQAWAGKAQPFDLETRGDQVCKIGFHYPEPVCYTAASATETRFPIPREIDLLQIIHNYVELMISKDQPAQIDSEQKLNEVGAALFIRDEDVKMVTRYYRALTLNNVGLDLQHIVSGEQDTSIPFVASVDWQGYIGIRGTLQVEGLLKFPAAGFNLDEQDTFAKLTEFFARHLDVQDFNDASIFPRVEPTRWIQSLERHFQLTQIYGLRGDRNQQTMHLLQEVIGPAIVGEYIFLPIYKSLLQTIKNLGFGTPQPRSYP